MRNIVSHKDMKVVTRREEYAKYMMKPNFKDRYLFLKELFTVKMGKTEMKMDKLVYLGTNKKLMFDVHHMHLICISCMAVNEAMLFGHRGDGGRRFL